MAQTRKSKPTNITLKPEILEILAPHKNKSKFISEAIILKHKVDSEVKKSKK